MASEIFWIGYQRQPTDRSSKWGMDDWKGGDFDGWMTRQRVINEQNFPYLRGRFVAMPRVCYGYGRSKGNKMGESKISMNLGEIIFQKIHFES